MQQKEEEIPSLGEQEVCIAIRSIGLNFADVFAIWGLYKATPKEAFIPGLEYAGEVVAVGAEVKDRQVGDKIMGVTRFGAYASHLNIDHRYVIPLPAGWSFEEGAGYLVQVLTALLWVDRIGKFTESGYGADSLRSWRGGYMGQ